MNKIDAVAVLREALQNALGVMDAFSTQSQTAKTCADIAREALAATANVADGGAGDGDSIGAAFFNALSTCKETNTISGDLLFADFVAAMIDKEVAERAATQPAVKRRKATDAEIAEWVDRNNLQRGLSGSGSDNRTAFEDAESLHMTFAAPISEASAPLDHQDMLAQLRAERDGSEGEQRSRYNRVCDAMDILICMPEQDAKAEQADSSSAAPSELPPLIHGTYAEFLAGDTIVCTLDQVRAYGQLCRDTATSVTVSTDRLQAALDSPSIPMPTGLGREKKREFIVATARIPATVSSIADDAAAPTPAHATKAEATAEDLADALHEPDAYLYKTAGPWDIAISRAECDNAARIEPVYFVNRAQRIAIAVAEAPDITLPGVFTSADDLFEAMGVDTQAPASKPELGAREVALEEAAQLFDSTAGTTHISEAIRALKSKTTPAAAPVEALTDEPKLAHGHRTDYYLMANARRVALLPIYKVSQMTNATLASELFATGSNSGHRICVDAGIDPYGYTVKKVGAA